MVVQVQPTSRSANEMMEQTGRKIRQQDRILKAMQDPLFGEGHSEKIALVSGLKPQQVWKRLSEMESKGLIINTGKTALLSSGVQGIVWRCCGNDACLQLELFSKQKQIRKPKVDLEMYLRDVILEFEHHGFAEFRCVNDFVADYIRRPNKNVNITKSAI